MIILASASPRRQELLSLICDEFSVEPADIDETIEKEIELEKNPEYLAVKKAKHIQGNNHFDDVVIGCDTGVFLDGIMLGKPSSKSDAAEMLCRLSGRKHKVITGCALLYKDRCISFSQTTEVEFFELTDREIEDYIATGEPMDKAGAYGIQGKGTALVKGIVGDFYNVVGLPVAMLNKKLKEIIYCAEK
ncbi:Maf family protein [Ruminococcus sp.]|uniref:Maf family protein n=1 Tax=Ruminococcus sp. TaxID=41978 RepID=UPI003F05A202